MTETGPFIVDKKENSIIQAKRREEERFIKTVNEHVHNELHSPPKFNMQAMTFYARSNEEMFKKVEEWLVFQYTRNLHEPKKKKWWRIWNDR